MNIRKVVSADGNVITVRDNSQSFTNNKRFKAGKIPWLKKESKLNNEPCINAIKPVFVFKDEQLIEKCKSMSICSQKYGIKLSSLSYRMKNGTVNDDGIYFKSRNEPSFPISRKNIMITAWKNREKIGFFGSAQEAAKEALITVHFLKKAIESGEEINGVVYKKC